MTTTEVTGLGDEIKPDFFNRCVDDVAAKLIGCYLFADGTGGRVGGQIIETEAYCENDPAAHCYNKKRSAKGKPLMCNSMFDPYGNVYIYPNSIEKPNDVHLNLVCREDGF